MKALTKTKKIVLLTAAFLLVVPSLLVLLPGKGNAAAMTNTIVRFDRMKISTATTGTVCAMSPSAASATETSVKVTFPTGYTVSSTVGDWTVSTANTAGWPSGGTAWTGISAPTGSGEFLISGQSVNFVSGNLASATTLYCFNWTSTAALTTKSSATNDNTGQVITQTTGGSASDTGNYATATVPEDSIVVTASVPPSFSFSFNNTSTDTFNNLSTGGSSTTGKQITLSTNATSGWIVWAKSTQGASKGSLHSSVASKYITSASAIGSASHTLGTFTEDYGLATTIFTNTNNGTLTLDPAYDGTSNKLGVLDSQNFRPIASASGTSTGDVLAVQERASITAATPAANDYTDTITFIGAGNF